MTAELRYACNECGYLYVTEEEAAVCCYAPHPLWLCRQCRVPYEDYAEAEACCGEGDDV